MDSHKTSPCSLLSKLTPNKNTNKTEVKWLVTMFDKNNLLPDS